MGSLAGTATRDDIPTPTLTTASGCPIAKPEGSLRDGKHLLLQDFNLIESLTHFNREKIPERTVHARGAGAYGEFEVSPPWRFLETNIIVVPWQHKAN